MNCASCGKPLKAGLTFCMSCGARVQDPTSVNRVVDGEQTGVIAAPNARRSGRVLDVELVGKWYQIDE